MPDGLDPQTAYDRVLEQVDYIGTLCAERRYDEVRDAADRLRVLVEDAQDAERE